MGILIPTYLFFSVQIQYFSAMRSTYYKKVYQCTRGAWKHFKTGCINLEYKMSLKFLILVGRKSAFSPNYPILLGRVKILKPKVVLIKNDENIYCIPKYFRKHFNKTISHNFIVNCNNCKLLPTFNNKITIFISLHSLSLNKRNV